MITVCKTTSGYAVNGKPVNLINDKIVQPNELNTEEEIALNNFIQAELNGLKLQRSCVTVK